MKYFLLFIKLTLIALLVPFLFKWCRNLKVANSYLNEESRCLDSVKVYHDKVDAKKTVFYNDSVQYFLAKVFEYNHPPSLNPFSKN